MRIGFIGLGLMGIPMCKNILAKGGDLSVWNRTPEKTIELVDLGAKNCLTPSELGKQVDVLITMVTAGEDVERVLFGLDGAVNGLKEDSIVIDMSTIGVEWANTINAKLSDRGICFIDAPVTGSTPKAITGELTIFVGGEPDTFEKIKPVLALMGTNIQYMGKNGKGQAMKLVNNTLVAYQMIGLAEVMKLANILELPLDRTAEVIKTLPVSSPYTAMKVENFVRDSYPMMFSLANMMKDIALAHSEMEKSGLSLAMLSHAYMLYTQGVDGGYGDMDVSAIAKIV